MSKLTYSVEVQLWVAATTSYSPTWTDITADVIMPGLTCSSGTQGTTIFDRVSGVGNCTFDLNNSESNSAKLAGYYSPDHANHRVGFNMGCPIRVRFTFEGLTRTKWYGRIYVIDPEPGTMKNRRTHITAYDWMYQASNYQLSLPEYQTDIGPFEAMRIIDVLMPIHPLATQNYFYSGYAYPVVFDNLGSKSTALAEFQKLALSNIGNIFLKSSYAFDEILCHASAYYREPGTEALFPEYYTNLYNLPASSCASLLNEDGSVLLNEDGSKLLVDDVDTLEFDDTQSDVAIAYGDRLFNRTILTTYPREVLNTLTTIYEQNSPLLIKAGQTIEFYKVVYADPTKPNVTVCAKDVVSPVATTDYLANTAEDGSGTDITADISITGILGLSDSELTITNNGGSDGYITWLQVRGKPIYIYNEVKRGDKSPTSIARYGERPLNYIMPYQPMENDSYSIVTQLKVNFASPFTRANSITFTTRDDDAVQKFLAIEVLAMPRIKESQSGLDSDHYVQGWSFTILGNNNTSGIAITETAYLYRREDSYILPSI